MSHLPAREDALRGSLLNFDGIVGECIASVTGIPKIQERISCEHVFGCGNGDGKRSRRPVPITGRMSNVEWGEASCTSLPRTG